MRGEEERCLAVGMDAYLAKPVAIDRLRATLERWLPIDDGAPAPSASIGAAIDRNVLAAWLGDDRSGIDELLNKFRDSAIESEQAIDAAWRRRRPRRSGGRRAPPQRCGTSRWGRSSWRGRRRLGAGR